MKKAMLVGLSVAALGALAAFTASAGDDFSGEQQLQAPSLQITGGKCNFNSDCQYGKCKNHKCGYCDFKSDCKGFGICKNHECGACNFSSECKGFGSCSSGKCTKSPW